MHTYVHIHIKFLNEKIVLSLILKVMYSCRNFKDVNIFFLTLPPSPQVNQLTFWCVSSLLWIKAISCCC